MTGREKIEKVTELIESEAKSHKSISSIADTVAQSIGMSRRDLSTVFMFFTGKTLSNYIRERKMMASCESILRSNKFDVQVAVEISGLCDQPTFNKSFKKQFNCTPTEAFKNKDYSLLKLRLTWDEMGENEILSISKRHIYDSDTSAYVFGIAQNKYEELIEIIELRETYNLDESKCEIAYSIHQEYNLTLQDTFRFISEFDYYLNSDGNDSTTENEKLSQQEYIEKVETYIDDPEFRYIFFNDCEQSISSTLETIDLLHFIGKKDITEIDIDIIIKAFAVRDETNMHLDFCLKAVLYFKDHATKEYGEDAFDEFVDYLLENRSIEEAFEDVYQTEGWDDYTDCYLTTEEFEGIVKGSMPDDPFENWIDEETNYGKYYHENDFEFNYESYTFDSKNEDDEQDD